MKVKFNLKNHPRTDAIKKGERLSCRKWAEGFEAELQEKDAKFAEEYIDYDENDLGELIKEILGEWTL